MGYKQLNDCYALVENMGQVAWQDALKTADKDMEHHARKQGKALLKIFYYSEGKVVRKIIERMPLLTEQHYVSEAIED